MIVRALWCRLVGRNFNHHNRLRRIRFHVDGHHLATQWSDTAASYTDSSLHSTAVQYSSRTAVERALARGTKGGRCYCCRSQPLFHLLVRIEQSRACCVQ